MFKRRRTKDIRLHPGERGIIVLPVGDGEIDIASLAPQPLPAPSGVVTLPQGLTHRQVEAVRKIVDAVGRGTRPGTVGCLIADLVNFDRDAVYTVVTSTPSPSLTGKSYLIIGDPADGNAVLLQP